jgi:NAD-dependent SIR2 family protein deacetylase
MTVSTSSISPPILGTSSRCGPPCLHTAVTPHAASAQSVSTQAAPGEAAPGRALAAAHDLLEHHRRWLVITGAGVSTASGIPGYRDVHGQWTRARPVTHQAFVDSAAARRRYWARSMAGWPLVRAAAPNAAHAALVALERQGVVGTIVTQNVDGLHERAGSASVVDLHGRIDTVVCLACDARITRDCMQSMLRDANAGLPGPAGIAPDGDADLDAQDDFVVPGCPACDGVLKPDVVFFGANVPSARVRVAFAALDACDGVLVAGTSLMAWSGYRFCLHARAAGKPIIAVNVGVTRADALLACKVDDDCTQALPLLAALRSGARDADTAPRRDARRLPV